jgi:hypothetical protein
MSLDNSRQINDLPLVVSNSLKLRDHILASARTGMYSARCERHQGHCTWLQNRTFVTALARVNVTCVHFPR